MARLFRPVTKISVSMPAAIASSAAYWIRGLSTIGNSSFGIAFVAGKNRVPNPATGKTALRIGAIVISISFTFQFFNTVTRLGRVTYCLCNSWAAVTQKSAKITS
jgi:hypothetical protein